MALKGTADFFNLIYPVGSIYMSVNSTNPATLFGGTWQQIKDTFLLASGTTYSAGTTGGEAKHTLTINEMPSHNHTYNEYVYISSGTDWGTKNSSAWGDTMNVVYGSKTGNTGGGQAHNNMPPYLAVYIWKRTA